jgi:hypothetical protein
MLSVILNVNNDQLFFGRVLGHGSAYNRLVL